MLHDRILSIRSGPRKYTLKDDILTNGYIFVWKVVQTSLFMVCSGSQLINYLWLVKIKYLLKQSIGGIKWMLNFTCMVIIMTTKTVGWDFFL